MNREQSDNAVERPETRRLLLAYPKSGTNMLRICTERITGFKTPGNVTYDAANHTSSLMAFARSHNVRKANRRRDISSREILLRSKNKQIKRKKY